MALRIIIHVLLPVTVGGAIYLFCRQGLQVHFLLQRYMGTTLYLGDSTISAALDNHLFHWGIKSLPAGLWTYSLLYAIGVIWKGGSKHGRIGWMSLTFITVTSMELGQLVGLIPGYFDIVDLATILVLSFIAIYQTQKGGAKCKETSSRLSY